MYNHYLLVESNEKSRNAGHPSAFDVIPTYPYIGVKNLASIQQGNDNYIFTPLVVLSKNLMTNNTLLDVLLVNGLDETHGHCHRGGEFHPNPTAIP